MIIKDLNSLRKFFKTVKRPIFGAGVYAFDRLGPENFIPNYQVLCLYSSKETRLIKEDTPIFCLEEAIGRRLRPRNSSTLLVHPGTQSYISKFREPLILVYKSSKRIEKASQKYGFRVANPSYRFGKQFLEDKIKFRNILHKIKVQPTPGRVLNISNSSSLSFLKLKKEFGLPFVMQHPRRGGGKGTFFIKNENEFIKNLELIKEKPTQEIIVAEFIKGPSPSITGCVTRFGTLSTRPQYQICDIPILYRRETGAGLFCGHDWSASDFTQNVLIQAREIVEKIGNYFKKLNYRGIFGIDFVLDKKTQKLYVTECNPRLLGSMPTLTMVEHNKGIPSIIAFHLLEYLGITYEINIKNILELLWQKREGTQMILHNPLSEESLQKGDVEPGIYQMTIKNRKKKTQQLNYLRKAYKFSHLKNKKEYLITEGIQIQGSAIETYQRLARILTKGRVLDKNFKDITPKTKEFLKLLLKQFKITKYS